MESLSEMERKVMDGKDEGKDIFRELLMKYGIFDIKSARKILGAKIKGKLSDTVIELREEE